MSPKLVQILPSGKVGEGMYGHEEYPIVFNPRLLFSDQEDGELKSYHRYSDFRALREALELEFPGAIVPPLPEKAVNALQNNTFLQNRRKYLQKFIRDIQCHEVLCNAQCFREFMLCSAIEFTTCKKRWGVKHNDVHGSILSDTKESLTLWWGKMCQRLAENDTVLEIAAKAGKNIKVANTTENDQEFLKVVQFCADLIDNMQSIQHQVDNVRTEGYAYATALHQLSLRVRTLGKELHNQKSKHGKHIMSMDAILKEKARHADGEFDAFSESIKYFTMCMNSAMEALKRREDKRYEYQAASAKFDKLKSSTDSFDINGRHSMIEAETKMHAIHAEFQTQHHQLMDEFAQFRIQKETELQKIFVRFAESQAIRNSGMIPILATAIPIGGSADIQSESLSVEVERGQIKHSNGDDQVEQSSVDSQLNKLTTSKLQNVEL